MPSLSLSATPPVAGRQEGWRSLIAEAPALRDKVEQVRTKDKKGYLLQKGHFIVMEAPNAAIRLRASYGAFVGLFARWSDTPTDGIYGHQVYAVKRNEDGGSTLSPSSMWTVSVEEHDGEKKAVISSPKVPPGAIISSVEPYKEPFTTGDYELELRAFGDKITVLFNGVIAAEYSNVTLPGQGFAVQANIAAMVTSIDWRPLSPIGEPIRDSARIPFPAPGPANSTSSGLNAATTHIWTDRKGRSIAAEFVRLTDDVLVVRINSVESSIPIDQLSDQSYKKARIRSSQLQTPP
jgi:hypothetical protein